MGRPSTYTPELADAICTRLATGESLHAICKTTADMPAEATVREWVVDDVQGFAAKYARARDLGLDCMADKMLYEAATPRMGIKRVRKPDGVEITHGDAVERSRLLVDAMKWYLSKIAPKKYGDRIEHHVDGSAVLRLEFGRRAELPEAINGASVRLPSERAEPSLAVLPTNQPMEHTPK